MSPPASQAPGLGFMWLGYVPSFGLREEIAHQSAPLAGAMRSRGTPRGGAGAQSPRRYRGQQAWRSPRSAPGLCGRGGVLGAAYPTPRKGGVQKAGGPRLLRVRLTDGAPGVGGAPAQLRARSLESLWASASLPELQCVEVPRVGYVRPAVQTPGPVTPGSAEGRGRQGVGTRGGAGAE